MFLAQLSQIAPYLNRARCPLSPLRSTPAARDGAARAARSHRARRRPAAKGRRNHHRSSSDNAVGSLVTIVAALGIAMPAWAGDLALNLPASASSTDRDPPEHAGARQRRQLRDALVVGSRGRPVVGGRSGLEPDHQPHRAQLGGCVRVPVPDPNAPFGVERVVDGRERVDRLPGAEGTHVQRAHRPLRTDPRRVAGDALRHLLVDARVCDGDSCAAPTPTPTPPPTPTPTPTPDADPAPNPSPELTLQQVDGGPTTTGASPTRCLRADYFPRAVVGLLQPHTERTVDLDRRRRDQHVRLGGRQLVSGRHPCRRPVPGDPERGQPRERRHRDRGLAAARRDRHDAGPGACPSALDSIVNGLPVGRPVPLLELRQGRSHLAVGRPDAARFVNAPRQELASSSGDDIYWFTDPNQRTPHSASLAPTAIGSPVNKLQRPDTVPVDACSPGRARRRAKPIWNFIETGWPWHGVRHSGRRRSAPKSSAPPCGTRSSPGPGGFFTSSTRFAGPCSGDHHMLRSNCEGTRPMVVSVNAQISSSRRC